MGVRPSDLYQIGNGPDDPVRFWFDRAVFDFGSTVEEDVRVYTEKAKTDKTARHLATQRLMKWLDFDGRLTSQRFAKPQVTKRRSDGQL